MTELIVSPPAAPTSRKALPVGLVLAGAISVHSGSAVAALLFQRAGVAGVVTLRLVISAALLLAVARPSLRTYQRSDWLTVGAFGLALAGMNGLFYESIQRIPLGIAVTIEVLGPLVLAVATGHRAIRWLWAALALVGVTTLGGADVLGSGSSGQGLDLLGVGFAVAAGGMWAAYIVLSARVGKRFAKSDGLAVSMAVAALIVLPWGIAASGPALIDPVTVGLGAAVAVLCSVVPYSFELLALRRMTTSTFAILVSIGPALAALAGFVILGQSLTPIQLVAMGIVIVACAGAVRT